MRWVNQHVALTELQGKKMKMSNLWFFHPNLLSTTQYFLPFTDELIF